MDEISSQRLLTKIGLAILVIALLDLVYLNWWIVKSGKLNPSDGENVRVADDRAVSLVPPSPPITPLPSPLASPAPEKEVPAKQTQTIVQTAQKEIFIPIGSGSTDSGSWTKIGGLEVTFDTSKYPAIDSIVFETSLWVVGGNGRAYARLYSATDQYVVVESQLSESSGTGVFKSSGKLPIPSGNKTYKIEAKTDITNFAAHVENARLKITLK